MHDLFFTAAKSHLPITFRKRKLDELAPFENANDINMNLSDVNMNDVGEEMGAGDRTTVDGRNGAAGKKIRLINVSWRDIPQKDRR